MRSRVRVCSVPGCPEYTDRGGRCDEHRRIADRARGTARQRGYGGAHERRFRAVILRRDPVCTCPGCRSCSTPDAGCTRASVHADHWPTDRRTLVARGLDPDDPAHGRGLCQPCHAVSTAAEQPGGWHA